MRRHPTAGERRDASRAHPLRHDARVSKQSAFRRQSPQLDGAARMIFRKLGNPLRSGADGSACVTCSAESYDSLGSLAQGRQLPTPRCTRVFSDELLRLSIHDHSSCLLTAQHHQTPALVANDRSALHWPGQRGGQHGARHNAVSGGKATGACIGGQEACRCSLVSGPRPDGPTLACRVIPGTGLAGPCG